MKLIMITGHFVSTVPMLLAICIGSTSAIAAPDKVVLKDSASNGDPNKERREWMSKGNAEYVQKHWEAARDCYLKSWDIKHHFTIAANLADVEMKLGHYAEAVGYLKYIMANVPESQADKRKLAETMLLECRSYLTAVHVATDVTDATVLVDGRDVGQTPLREDLLLEPGKHVISVTKPGYGNQTQELSAEGNHVDITLTLEKPAASPAPPVAAPAIQTQVNTEDSGHTSGYRIGAYVGFGVGVLGIGAGTYFLLKAQSTQSDSDHSFSACTPNCSASAQQDIASLDTSAQHQRTGAAVSYIVGGVGLATGITLLLLEPKNQAKTMAGRVLPWVGVGRAGLYGVF
jgi:hypothetical protein